MTFTSKPAKYLTLLDLHAQMRLNGQKMLALQFFRSAGADRHRCLQARTGGLARSAIQYVGAPFWLSARSQSCMTKTVCTGWTTWWPLGRGFSTVSYDDKARSIISRNVSGATCLSTELPKRRQIFSPTEYVWLTTAACERERVHDDRILITDLRVES